MNRFLSWLTGYKNTTGNTLKAGQAWQYKTRAGEESSLLTILKIDRTDPGNVIVHITVTGLKIKNPHYPTGLTEVIGHSPVSEEAVLKSITTLVSENTTLPDFSDGYGRWKDAFDKNEAGVFSLEVSEIVNCMEEAINRGTREEETEG